MMSFFLSPLHSAEPFWSHVLHFMPWKLSLPHFQKFFFITCYSSLLLTSILKIGNLQSLKPIYILYPNSQNISLVTNRPLANQYRCFLAAVNFQQVTFVHCSKLSHCLKKLKLSKKTCSYLGKLSKQSTTMLKAISQKFTIMSRKMSLSCNM